jgi:PAS domain S-box-containing protein
MNETAFKTFTDRTVDAGVAPPLRVLMVEDHPLDVELCEQELKRAGFQVRVDRVDTEEQFAALLASNEYDIVLSDYGIPGWSGIAAFRLLKEMGMDIPFILVTGTLGEEAAVELMKQGVSDYVLKDRLVRLPVAVRGAFAERNTRQARQRAEERYHRLAQAVESSSELMCMGDPEGKMTFGNQAFLAALEFTEADLLGKSFADNILSPNNSASLDAEIRSAILAKGGWAGECLFRRKNGADLPVYLTAGQVKDAAGATVGTFASAQDVSERNWTMQALRESEERVRLLLDSTSEAIYGVDLQNRCFLCNRAGALMLGYAGPVQLIGRNMHAVAHHTRPDGTPYPEAECSIRRVLLEAESLHTDEEFLWRKDGSGIAVELWAHPIVWNGKQIGAVVIFLDITERKRTEGDLRRLAAIVESSRDSIIGEALDGTILSWNAGAERIYGYSSAEMIGKSGFLLAPPEHQKEASELLERIKRGQKIEPFETVRMRKDGRRIHVALTLSEVKEASGRISGASVIARDITESKRLEEMFRQAQKMEAIGRLAGGIAHDFNNVLGVIIGYSEMLLEKFDAASDLRKPIEEIKKAGDRASAMTRQLLVYSRQQIVERRVVNLNQSVAEMDNMLRRMIGEDVELRTILNPLLGRVKADPGQIQQAINEPGGERA